MQPTTAGSDDLDHVLRNNIEDMRERRARERERAPIGERLARGITRFTGSMVFVYLHLALYGGWILLNVGMIPGLRPFDPSFVILASEASVEAIFLSTFVLISQNRMAAEADLQASLDLHINLLTEHELTRLARAVDAIARHLDVPSAASAEIERISRDVEPQAVLDAIDESKAADD
jgi:uncharacterized membrane protein